MNYFKELYEALCHGRLRVFNARYFSTVGHGYR